MKADRMSGVIRWPFMALAVTCGSSLTLAAIMMVARNETALKCALAAYALCIASPFWVYLLAYKPRNQWIVGAIGVYAVAPCALPILGYTLTLMLAVLSGSRTPSMPVAMGLTVFSLTSFLSVCLFRGSRSWAATVVSLLGAGVAGVLSGIRDSEALFLRAFETWVIAWALACVAVGWKLLHTPPPSKTGRCAQCGYDLTGLPAPVCPECGLVNAS